MLTPISTKIEEFENEGLPHSTVCYIKTFNDCDRDCPNKVAKDFLRTALQQRDEEWRELVGYVRESAESCAVLARENESNNIRNNIIRPLNDIITKSKENN